MVVKAIDEQAKGNTSLLFMPTTASLNLLAEAEAEMVALGRVKWLHSRTGEPWATPGHTTAFILAGRSDGALTCGDGIESKGSHVGSIYHPGVRNSAGEFSSSNRPQPTLSSRVRQTIAGLLPLLIRRIEGTGNGHKRVSRVPNGHVDWEGQADIAHCRTDVVGDCVE